MNINREKKITASVNPMLDSNNKFEKALRIYRFKYSNFIHL